MNKWTCTIIQNTDSGKYHADMLIDNKNVDGIPFDVDYKTLTEAIKRVTGISILKRKEMIFERLSDFEKIATLDNTQCRNDCRVTVEERIRGWMPCWNEEE